MNGAARGTAPSKTRAEKDALMAAAAVDARRQMRDARALGLLRGGTSGADEAAHQWRTDNQGLAALLDYADGKDS